MRKLTSFLLMLVTSLLLAVPVYAETGVYTFEVGDNISLLHDLDDSLTEDEEQGIVAVISSITKETGFNIAIVITDDIGLSKSDDAVMDFADVYYEKYCGMNTDGILLLLNNDTKYDWISTSGECIDIFYNDIDAMFDNMWYYLDNGDFTGAITTFCNDVYRYNTQDYDYDYEYHYSYEYSSDDVAEDAFVFIFVGIFFTAIALFILIAVVNNSYKLKNTNAAQYMLENSLDFSICSDSFIRTYTTRTRISSSSSSGGSRSRSRSSGSRSHRSSSGGRHGGGGRRR